MSIFSCLDDVVGISRKADLCTGTDAYVSKSGLFVDELQGMALRILNSTGGNTTLLEKMYAARENAINAFKVDVLREILKTKEPARSKFNGDIGGKTFTSKLSDADYHGLRMYSDIIGGSFTLRGVTVIIDDGNGIDLEVYTGDDDEDGASAIDHFHLTSLAGRPKFNAVTATQYSLKGNLYFLYQTIGLPYNNKLTCNCGGFRWCFNIDNPCFKASRDKWTEWAMIGGISGDTLSERDDWGTTRDARGLILHGDFGCDVLGMLCDDHSDWSSDPVDSAIAWALVYKAGSFLSAYIMDSEEVSRYTLLGVDGLTANMIYYEERYKVMIEFIAENIELNRNECLKCRSPFGYHRQSQML
jgi:hypothetical protein